MAWIVLWSWVAAIGFALVVLGFCSYEVYWKIARLGSDVERLNGVAKSLTQLQAEFLATAERAAAAQRSAAPQPVAAVQQPSAIGSGRG